MHASVRFACQFALLVLVLMPLGCDRARVDADPVDENTSEAEIPVSTAENDSEQQALREYLGAQEAGAKPTPRPDLTYQAPEAWIENKPGGMRAASFTVAGDDGKQAYLAVIPLKGPGGGLLANVNQWRSTLDLENAAEDELPEMVEEIELRGRPFKMVDFESAEPVSTNDRKSRLVVAFTTENEHTWFFKLAGDAELVAEQKPVLLEFLKSVEFVTP